MSVFLERQKVRKKRAMARWFKFAERILFSVAIILCGLAMLYGFYLLVFLGPTFSVREIIVEGNLYHTSVDRVVDLSQVKQGDNLFGIDVAMTHKRLKEDPWIESAAVRRRLPHSLWIYVEEYKPVAIVQKEGRLFYVDQERVAFKEVEPMDPKSFPVITGSDETNLGEVLAFLDAYNNSSFGEVWGISEMHSGGSNGYSIITQKGPVEIFLGNGAYASRLDLLGRWQGVIGRRGGRITYIIANEDKRITVGYRNSPSDQGPGDQKS